MSPLLFEQADQRQGASLFPHQILGAVVEERPVQQSPAFIHPPGFPPDKPGDPAMEGPIYSVPQKARPLGQEVIRSLQGALQTSGIRGQCQRSGNRRAGVLLVAQALPQAVREQAQVCRTRRVGNLLRVASLQEEIQEGHAPKTNGLHRPSPFPPRKRQQLTQEVLGLFPARSRRVQNPWALVQEGRKHGLIHGQRVVLVRCRALIEEPANHEGAAPFAGENVKEMFS
ncbi:MAG TPA: hypothetical protein VLQ45_06960 [Thermoanaerobaculia bacterium]|nr:hypothetical protein [Thermoanaerobaculia bacterium]